MMFNFKSKSTLKKENEELKQQIAFMRAELIVYAGLVNKFNSDLHRLRELLIAENPYRNLTSASLN